jgi:TatD DNase family protein
MDILPILEARQGKIRGVLHCFTGDVELMHRSLEVGFHIGIGGIVTYPNAKGVQTVAKEVSEDRLLIETDCPWLAPQFRRGKRNEPAYVRSVAEKIADLRGTSVETIGKITTNNFQKLFAHY